MNWFDEIIQCDLPLTVALIKVLKSEGSFGIIAFMNKRAWPTRVKNSCVVC